MTFADVTGSTGAATAPGGCLAINVTLLGSTVCTITVSATTISATYVNTSTALKTDNPNGVPYTSTGMLCGSNGMATYKAQYVITPNSFQATVT
jgi:hypothetical protein